MQLPSNLQKHELLDLSCFVMADVLHQICVVLTLLVS